MSDNTKDESYWIGVRDALRMVDSFIRWSRRNPTIAKTLDEFLAEGLVAAAKRCESCLGRELGLKYGKEDPEKGMDESDFAEAGADIDVDEPVGPPSDFDLEDEFDSHLPEDGVIDESELVEALESEGFDVVTEHVSKLTKEIAEEGVAEPVSIEGIESDRIVSPPSIDELELEEESGEFTSDFELAEPEPLVIDDGEVPEISPPPEEPLSYEITPPTSDSEEEESEITTPETPLPPVREIWSPYDEPAISNEERVTDDDDVVSEDTSDTAEDEVEETETPVKKVPPPPPPPETDENEEERQKRARRLFFGA